MSKILNENHVKNPTGWKWPNSTTQYLEYLTSHPEQSTEFPERLTFHPEGYTKFPEPLTFHSENSTDFPEPLTFHPEHFTEFPKPLTHSYHELQNETITIIDVKTNGMNSESFKLFEKWLTYLFLVFLGFSFIFNLGILTYHFIKSRNTIRYDSKIIRRWLKINFSIGNYTISKHIKLMNFFTQCYFDMKS